MLSSPASNAWRPAPGNSPNRGPTAANACKPPAAGPSFYNATDPNGLVIRPKTSHSRLQPVPSSEPSRVPQPFNPTPAVASFDRPSTNHSSYEPTVHGLSSYASFGSLKSSASDEKKRKRLLPFTSKFVGAWKEGVSANAEGPEQRDTSKTDRLENLPSDLKPAAARRLGIESKQAKAPTKMRDAFVIRTGPSSVVHSRMPSLRGPAGVPLPPINASKASSQTAPSDRAILPHRTSPTHQTRPHNGVGSSLAAEARKYGVNSIDFVEQAHESHPAAETRRHRIVNNDFTSVPSEAMPHKPGLEKKEIAPKQEPQQMTFYASSSDSEEDDDDKHSSGYSYNSSHTSYNVASPLSMDSRKMDEQFTYFHATQAAGSRKETPLASAPNHWKSPASSAGPHHGGGTASPASRGGTSSPASRPTSFSRPFTRGLSHSGTTTPRDSELDTQAHLAAIREHSPFQAEDLPANRPRPRTPQKAANHFRKLPPTPIAKVPMVTSHELKPTTIGTHPTTRNMVQMNIGAARRKEQPKLANDKSPYSHPRPPTADKKSARPLSLAVAEEPEALISALAAEAVILHIFETIDNFNDLFSCARLNRGFYKVFKRHELRLMKNTLRNQSPAQWEHREASPKEITISGGTPRVDYTPTSYIQFHKRDTFILSSLKAMIIARCQASLRFETVNALADRDAARSMRVDDALWRIWTFCSLFGSDKGREHEIVTQTDWLRGGATANRPTSNCSHPSANEVKSADPFESFGRGNYGGLTVTELYDITEMWSCIKALLSGISGAGRCSQARQYGVFDGHGVSKGDRKGEESLLDEWIFYVATLGLSAVVDLATHSNSSTDEVFSVAGSMGWAKWGLPNQGKSREGFLQKAVKIVYDETMIRTRQVSDEQVRAKRRSRGYELAAQLREENTKGNGTGDLFSQHQDQSIKVWLEWMAKVESAKGAHMKKATRPGAPKPIKEEEGEEEEEKEEEQEQEVRQNDSKARDAAAKYEESAAQPQESAAKPTSRGRSASSLSLFPSTRPTPVTMPKMSPITTPRRSRNSSRNNSRSNSIVRQKGMMQRGLVQEVNRRVEERQQPEQLFTPRLSMCQEA